MFINDGHITTVEILIVVFGVLALIFLVLFIYYFTKPLPDIDECNRGDEGENEQCKVNYLNLKRNWMVLSYAFMIFSLIMAIFPFIWDFKLEPGDDGYVDQVYATLDKPITVFRGCVLDKHVTANALSCYPEYPEKSEYPPSLSWILHIGGHLTAFSPAEEYVNSSNKDNQKRLIDIKEEIKKVENEMLKKEEAYESLNSDWKQLTEDEKKSTANKGLRENLLKAQIEKNDAVKDYESKQARIIQLERYLYGDNGYGVNGGLAVPFYIIILSMIGAAISLTRRIPEYQKQAVAHYVGTEAAPKLTPRLLREYLVFQIVQFISAPFLAIVAYLIVEPETTPSVVALAFAAGFASETVLLWVRGVVDKINPDVSLVVHKGSVVGTVPDMISKSAKDLEKELSIKIVGHHDLQTYYTDNGQFVINDVPEGAWALEVNRIDMQNNTKKTIYLSIKIDADKPTPVIIEFQ